MSALSLKKSLGIRLSLPGTSGKEYSVNVKAGEVLGTAGGNTGQGALDLGVYDWRHTPEQIANPQRWQEKYIHTVCPLSYFEKGPVLDQLLALGIGNKGGGETWDCGSVLQDLPGTAQGIWVVPGTEYVHPENPHLALVHSNLQPETAVLSIGNSVSTVRSDAYEFSPKISGQLNRDFPDITSDGQIYGFQVDAFDGIIIVQMPDRETLWIEGLEGATIEPTRWAFTQNKTVFIR